MRYILFFGRGESNEASSFSVVCGGFRASLYREKNRSLMVEVEIYLMVIQTFRGIQACLEELGIGFMLVDILSVILLLCGT